jgi:signal transduction histidine kinase
MTMAGPLDVGTPVVPGRWGHRADQALAAGLLLAALAVLRWVPIPVYYRRSDLGAVVLTVAASTTVVWRRTWPVPAFLAACLVVLVNASLGYTIGAIQYAVWIGLYSALSRPGAQAPARAGLVVVGAATVAGYAALDRGPFDANVAVGIAVFFGLAAMGGEISRTRRTLVVLERDRHQLQASEQAALREQVVLQERARLASELHDAFGHGVNVMVMQAGVARHVFDERPDYARTALAQIEAVGRDALAELDQVLDLLRPGDEPRPGGPLRGDHTVPALAAIDAVCQRIRDTGRDVQLRLAPVELGPAGERTVYRIVQEAVTNAARHSTGGTIEVTLEPVLHGTVGAGPTLEPPVAEGTADPGWVVLTVRNPNPDTKAGQVRRPGGRGLLNMRERARLGGGDLTWTAGNDEFEVRATLPVAVGPPAPTTLPTAGNSQ